VLRIDERESVPLPAAPEYAGGDRKGYHLPAGATVELVLRYT
jgi:hypothetical protein